MQKELGVMQLSDARDDAQSEPYAAVATVHAYKGLTEFAAFRLINPRSFIFHCHHWHQTRFHRHADRRPLRAVAMGILHQIAQNDADERRVARDDGLAFDIRQQQPLLALGQHGLQLILQRFDHVIQQQHLLIAAGGKD